jgi:hypothetical protein
MQIPKDSQSVGRSKNLLIWLHIIINNPNKNPRKFRKKQAYPDLQFHSESAEPERPNFSVSSRSSAFWWAQVSIVRSGLALRPTPRITIVKKLVM